MKAYGKLYSLFNKSITLRDHLIFKQIQIFVTSFRNCLKTCLKKIVEKKRSLKDYKV